MNSYWKWKCEECGHEFILALVRLPEACHRCGGEWFLKVGESLQKNIELTNRLESALTSN